MSAAPEEVRLLEASEARLWDELVDACASTPLFASREWVDRIARAYGGRVRLVGAFRRGDLVGGAALPVRRRAGLSIATAPYLLPYLPLLAEEGRPETVRGLLRYLAGRYPLLSLLLPPEGEDVRAFGAEGWELAYRYTLRIDLRGATAESLLGRMEKSQRRRVRRAEEEGAVVRRSLSSEEHCRLVLASYRRQRKRFPIPEEEEAGLGRWIVESGRGRVYELLRGGRTAATFLIGMDGRRAYSLESGVDWEIGRGGESAFLLIRILSELAAEGIPEFDFLGVNHPSISRFKESFGGTLARYHAAAPPRPFWIRILLRLRGAPASLEIAGEGSASRQGPGGDAPRSTGEGRRSP
ncbi:MAG: GNAT family N-acetyltransferase [Candidatus Eisenbacteria bacterium]